MRADPRWIRGDYSARYRFRLGANLELTCAEHPVLPYFNVEASYDTRYDGWARTLFRASVEVPVDRRFRYEIVLVRQMDRLPAPEKLNARVIRLDLPSFTAVMSGYQEDIQEKILPTNVRVCPLEMFLTVLATLVISHLATIYPALKAARERPVDAMRYE